MDTINGQPLGAVRASFGAYSTPADADALLKMIEKEFVQSEKPELKENFDEIKVSQIILYPIKGCAGIEVKLFVVQKKCLVVF